MTNSSQPSRIYYKMDSTKLTYKEYWRLSGGFLGFIYCAANKILNRQIVLGYGFPHIDHINLLKKEEVPKRARRRLIPLMDDCRKEGLLLAFHYTIPAIGSQECYATALSNSDDTVSASVIYTRNRTGDDEFEEVEFCFHSRFSEGPVLFTSGNKKTLDSPEDFDVVYLPRRSVSEVFSHHQNRLDTHVIQPPLKIGSESELEHFISEINSKSVNFFLQRGFYIPMRPDEVDRAITERDVFWGSSSNE